MLAQASRPVIGRHFILSDRPSLGFVFLFDWQKNGCYLL
jgi:hypothetical protein